MLGKAVRFQDRIQQFPEKVTANGLVKQGISSEMRTLNTIEMIEMTLHWTGLLIVLQLCWTAGNFVLSCMSWVSFNFTLANLIILKSDDKHGGKAPSELTVKIERTISVAGVVSFLETWRSGHKCNCSIMVGQKFSSACDVRSKMCATDCSLAFAQGRDFERNMHVLGVHCVVLPLSLNALIALQLSPRGRGSAHFSKKGQKWFTNIAAGLSGAHLSLRPWNCLGHVKTSIRWPWNSRITRAHFVLSGKNKCVQPYSFNW